MIGSFEDVKDEDFKPRGVSARLRREMDKEAVQPRARETDLFDPNGNG